MNEREELKKLLRPHEYEEMIRFENRILAQKRADQISFCIKTTSLILIIFGLFWLISLGSE